MTKRIRGGPHSFTRPMLPPVCTLNDAVYDVHGTLNFRAASTRTRLATHGTNKTACLPACKSAYANNGGSAREPWPLGTGGGQCRDQPETWEVDYGWPREFFLCHGRNETEHRLPQARPQTQAGYGRAAPRQTVLGLALQSQIRWRCVSWREIGRLLLILGSVRYHEHVRREQRGRISPTSWVRAPWDETNWQAHATRP